jgi:hypothetical protein
MRSKSSDHILLHGARCTFGVHEPTPASIHVSGKWITRIVKRPSFSPASKSGCPEIDLSGFLLMPGLINAHDHLEFSLFPRMANPPYQNYIDWGIDIHKAFPQLIAKHRAVPKPLRLWWGGIRNLLCGATTVSHHNPLWPDIQRTDFPVRVIQEYGWGHSLALGGDLRAAHAATPVNRPFILHAGEGVDDRAGDELWQIDQLGLLDANTVLVHGLAIDDKGIQLMRNRGASLIVCPSSNKFLFGKIPDLPVLGQLDNVALGNDSPLTAHGNLLDEINFAIHLCNISPEIAYRMVTEAPAAILRLRHSEGSLKVSGISDIIAVRDTGHSTPERLRSLSIVDIEFVMLGGHIQLASEDVLHRLPSSAKQGLEPLCIDGILRWLRAPVKELLQKTEDILGVGEVRLGGKPITIPNWIETRQAS